MTNCKRFTLHPCVLATFKRFFSDLFYVVGFRLISGQWSSCSTSCHWSSVFTASSESGHPLFLQPTCQQRAFLFSQECALAPWPERRSRNKVRCQRLGHTGGSPARTGTTVWMFWLFCVQWVLTETASAPPLCLFCWAGAQKSGWKFLLYELRPGVLLERVCCST